MEQTLSDKNEAIYKYEYLFQNCDKFFQSRNYPAFFPKQKSCSNAAASRVFFSSRRSINLSGPILPSSV